MPLQGFPYVFRLTSLLPPSSFVIFGMRLHAFDRDSLDIIFDGSHKTDFVTSNVKHCHCFPAARLSKTFFRHLDRLRGRKRFPQFNRGTKRALFDQINPPLNRASSIRIPLCKSLKFFSPYDMHSKLSLAPPRGQKARSQFRTKHVQTPVFVRQVRVYTRFA